MKTTRHFLRHPSCEVALTLDEGTGIFDLRFRAPHKLPDPTFSRALEKWCGKVGCDWARRLGYEAGSVVSLHFSSQVGNGYQGSFRAHLDTEESK